MKKILDRLFEGCGLPYLIHGKSDIEVTGLTTDSREVRPGFIFVALPGEQNDGRQFIQDAYSRGAVAVLMADPPSNHPGHLTFIQAAEVTKLMAALSISFHETAAPPLCAIGVTGTNGKTTTATILNELLKGLGHKTLFVGTTGLEIAGQYEATDYTTPPAPTLHRLIRQGLDAGISHLVMEVSSHALKLDRVFGMHFDAAIFTNLTHEHMELHASMEDYFQTKRKLFEQLKPHGVGIVNSDDAFGRRLREEYGFLDYGLQGHHAQLINTRFNQEERLQVIQCTVGGRMLDCSLPMMGRHNAANALAAVTTLLALGYDEERLLPILKAIKGVPGRVEIMNMSGIRIVIDFAHTPDALEKILEALLEIKGSAKIITVFGCPGSRDPSKRPLMGAIAARLSNRVVLTTDDIHYEEPQAIVDDIQRGIESGNYEVILDRREAIARALDLAASGDIVLVAGRGHERFQYVRDQKVEFEDKTVVLEEAGKLGLYTD